MDRHQPTAEVAAIVASVLGYLRVGALPSQTALEHAQGDLASAIDILQQAAASPGSRLGAHAAIRLDDAVRALSVESARVRAMLDEMQGLSPPSAKRRAAFAESLCRNLGSLLARLEQQAPAGPGAAPPAAALDRDGGRPAAGDDLLALIQQLIRCELSPEAFQARVNHGPLAGALAALVGHQLRVERSVIAIGPGAQTGDITIRDVAGGDIIHLTIHVHPQG